MPTVSVVIPAYNEEATLVSVVKRVLSIPQITEVIIVNDCSTDATGKLADEIAQANPSVHAVHQTLNQGKTEALKTGFARTTGDIVLVQDADFEYDPSEIPEVVAPIIEGHADVVYGSFHERQYDRRGDRLQSLPR